MLQSIQTQSAVAVGSFHKAALHTPLTVTVVTPQHPARAEVEQFICAKYWLSFSACLRSLPDQLIALWDQQQQLVAACAISFADQQGLFSERYLSAPIEQAIKQAANDDAQRQQIAEIGSMACLDFHYLEPLFAAVVLIAKQTQLQWLVFTATAPLRRHLKRLQLPTEVLASANIDCLADNERGLWGNYYRHQPLVIAGRVSAGDAHQQQWQGELLCK